MNLTEFKFEPLKNLTQAIIFDQKGAVLESDNTIVKIKDSTSNIFEDTMFCGMEDEFTEMKVGDQLSFDCINTDLFGRESQYDFIIKRLDDDEIKFGLIVYDFGEQYNKVFELQQERNMAEIQSRKLEREGKQLFEQKETIEKLYNELLDGNASEYILVKSDNLLVNIDLNKILYLEAYGDYVKVHTSDKVYLTHNTMKKIEEVIPMNRFMRVHRSFIVQLDKIGNIEQMSLLVSDKVIPIGKSYKAPLLEKMKLI